MASESLEYAGLGSRAIALIIDSILIGIAGAAIVFTVFGLPGGGTFSTPNLALMGIGLAYFVALEGANNGQTLGKSLVNIRVTTTNGDDLDFQGAVIRNVLRIVDMLPFLYIIGIILVSASDEEQRLGDMVGKSVVVKA